MQQSLWKLFKSFFILGCTSFGGPIAHIGYLREQFVIRDKIMTEEQYLQLVTFCQLLPGPTSSQLSILIGMSNRGIIGGILGWLGFLMPSAVFLSLCGLYLQHLTLLNSNGWVHGLKLVAFVVVTDACLFMTLRFCTTIRTKLIMLIAVIICITLPTTSGQLICLICGALIGRCILPKNTATTCKLELITISNLTSILALIIFIALLAYSLLSINPEQHLWYYGLAFFKAGSLVFGGGHVVLPLLQQVTVPNLLSSDVFLAGYGITQAMPGPLFSFAAYLGSVETTIGSPLLCAVIFTLAIYLPAFLLVIALFPHWQKIQHIPSINQVVNGINASVVGMLIAALYNPIFINSVYNLTDVIFAIIAFLLLRYSRMPLWLFVILGAIAGFIIY